MSVRHTSGYGSFQVGASRVADGAVPTAAVVTRRMRDEAGRRVVDALAGIGRVKQVVRLGIVVAIVVPGRRPCSKIAVSLPSLVNQPSLAVIPKFHVSFFYVLTLHREFQRSSCWAAGPA